jgi:hypothetical protein
MNKIEQFISIIRDSFIGSQEVYTRSSCYHFYLILKYVFPGAEPWYNQDHVITKIGDSFYDITGKIAPSISGDFSNIYYCRQEENDIFPSPSLKYPYNIYKLE